MAEEKAGGQFDIKVFHDKVIANGNVSLPMFEAARDRWMLKQQH